MPNTSISKENTLAAIFNSLTPVHNYVQQDVDIFLNKTIVFYHSCVSIYQYVYNACAENYKWVYESLNQPTNCYTTVSKPITMTDALNYVGQGYHFKSPLFYREIKTICSYSNPLDYISLYSLDYTWLFISLSLYLVFRRIRLQSAN